MIAPLLSAPLVVAFLVGWYSCIVIVWITLESVPRCAACQRGME